MTGHRMIFGPVPSRRLGRSLGINNISPKRCTYSCVYCQAGVTSGRQVKRESFSPVAELVGNLERRLEALDKSGEIVDAITFVSDGEPTLDADLGRKIEAIRHFRIPIAVITNGSLLWRADVRAELMNADWVSLKLDAAHHAVWRRINRPYRGLELERIIDGMYTFADLYSGTLVTETMLVQELNDTIETCRNIAGILQRLHPSIAYIMTPTRPPAEEWVRPVREAALARARNILRHHIPVVHTLAEYEGNAFAFEDDIEEELLAITAVHPLREDAVDNLLAQAGADWSVVERLEQRGLLRRTRYADRTFFLPARRRSMAQDVRERLGG